MPQKSWLKVYGVLKRIVCVPMHRSSLQTVLVAGDLLKCVRVRPRHPSARSPVLLFQCTQAASLAQPAWASFLHHCPHPATVPSSVSTPLAPQAHLLWVSSAQALFHPQGSELWHLSLNHIPPLPPLTSVIQRVSVEIWLLLPPLTTQSHLISLYSCHVLCFSLPHLIL